MSMLLRFDPVFREFDRLTQDLWRNQGRPGVSAMPMDAYREGDQFTVHFDLPGVDPSSIDLTVEKNVLTVRAERSWPRTEGQEIVVSERPQGTFSRQLFLGESLDADRIAADYRNGVLTLRLPVAEAAKPRKVEIQAGDGNGDSKPEAISATSTQS
jgi:HSP20 family protein